MREVVRLGGGVVTWKRVIRGLAVWETWRGDEVRYSYSHRAAMVEHERGG